jgi:hypothetical protein
MSVRAVLAGWLGALGLFGGAGGEEKATLYLFLSPRSEGGAAAARRARLFVETRKGLVLLRPVLLVSDFDSFGRLEEGSPADRTLRALGRIEVPLYDEEGLALARAWGISSVPAFVLVSRGRAHRALGAGADLEELSRCAR